MNLLRKFTGGFIVFLTFLLPLKFGSLAVMPEMTGYFPGEIWEYLIVNFPAGSFGMFSGLALLLLLLTFPEAMRKKDSGDAGTTMWLWVLLGVLSLFGSVNASMRDYVWQSVGYCLGISAYVAAIYLLVKSDEGYRETLFNSITLSLLCVLAVGIHQYFWGFDDQLRFFQENQDTIPRGMKLEGKLNERRIFATYSSCNALAGYLLLTIGIAWTQVWKWSERVAPPEKSRMLFSGLLLLIFLFVLSQTGSRAALAALAGSGVLMVLRAPLKRKYKSILVLLLIACALAGIGASVWFGRTFGSFQERIGYLRSSLMMMIDYPIFGSGWGDFFVDNMKFRTLSLTATARAPHNIWLSFGSQAGVFALVAAIAAAGYPLLRFCRKIRQEGRKNADLLLLFSLLAFSIHSCMEINFQIPSSMGLYGAILVLAVYRPGAVRANSRLRTLLLKYLVLVLLAVAALVLSLYNTVSEFHFDRFSAMIRDPETTIYDRKELEKHYAVVECYKPYSPFHPMEMGNFLLQHNRRVEALPYLEKAVARAPERPGYLTILAGQYHQSGETQKAEELWQKAMILYPANPKYREMYQILFKKAEK